MTQTKFVLSKALQAGLRPIVVLNKVDREASRIAEVESDILDLLIELDASDDQLEYPVLYASAKNGWVVNDYEAGDEQTSVEPLFQAILDHVPPPPEPKGEMDGKDGRFQLLITMMSYDTYMGRLLTGRMVGGPIKVGDVIHGLALDGSVVEQGKVTRVMAQRGTDRIELAEGKHGDIIQIAGLSSPTVSQTLASVDVREALPTVPIDQPTLNMTFAPNTSPLAGKEGSKLTSQNIKDRLKKELETNVALRVSESEENAEAMDVMARGELQLGILIEQMRREGFELSISPPKVIFKEENGKKLEPMEEVIFEITNDYSGGVVENIGKRKGELLDMKSVGTNSSRITALIPSRTLMGYRTDFETDTRGSGIMTSSFHSYAPYKGHTGGMRKGVLVSTDSGPCTAYILEKIEARGKLFVGPQMEVYPGMVIGQNSKDGDMDVNPCKAKQLTNVRASGTDGNIQLTPPRIFSLEEMMGYCADDELVEVTPTRIRLRKAELDSNRRRKKK